MQLIMETKTIVYFKHGLGNLIMFSPALQALALADESKQIDICMSSFWEDPRRPAYDEYFKLCPFVQSVVNYPKEIFTKKYNTWFYTNHSEASEVLDVFRNKNTLNVPMPDWSTRSVHEIFWYMNIVDLHGYMRTYNNKGYTPPQFVPVTDEPILDFKNIKIGICNGTFSHRMKNGKQWPYFNELVTLLKQYYDCTVIKIGYQDEMQDVKADVDYVDKLTFCQSAKVISQLDLLITNDTALMHVGDALNVPMIVIFGGTLISKNGAISSNAVNICAGLDCQPCQRTINFYNCPHYNCLLRLGVDMVMSEVRKKLIVSTEKETRNPTEIMIANVVNNETLEITCAGNVGIGV